MFILHSLGLSSAIECDIGESDSYINNSVSSQTKKGKGRLISSQYTANEHEVCH